jgi:hypothetical protein
MTTTRKQRTEHLDRVAKIIANRDIPTQGFDVFKPGRPPAPDTSKMVAPDIDAMAENVMATYRTASDAQRADGMVWYAEAHALAVTLARSAGHETLRAAGVISALSPQMSWEQNQRLAIRTYAEGGISAGALGVSVRKADAIYHGADVMITLKAPKTSAFALVIADPTNGHDVVIDRHAMSVAHGRQTTDDETAALNRKGFYQAYADAYRKAAAEIGITPSQMQAITWVAWRETSIRVSASVRKAAGR